MKMAECSKKVENIRSFSFLQQCFQQTCTADTSKPGLVWDKVKPFLFEKYGFIHLFKFSNYDETFERKDAIDNHLQHILLLIYASACKQDKS